MLSHSGCIFINTALPKEIWQRTLGTQGSSCFNRTHTAPTKHGVRFCSCNPAEFEVGRGQTVTAAHPPVEKKRRPRPTASRPREFY